MKIGFTGTRKGMSMAQHEAITELLRSIQGDGEFHHGDCIGADEEAHHIADSLNITPVIHPPADAEFRAHAVASDIRPPKTHFARNRDIVDECDHLLATPWQETRPAPKTGGGTWYTIQYAEKRSKRVTIVWPDGSLTESWPISSDSVAPSPDTSRKSASPSHSSP